MCNVHIGPLSNPVKCNGISPLGGAAVKINIKFIVFLLTLQAWYSVHRYHLPHILIKKTLDMSVWPLVTNEVIKDNIKKAIKRLIELSWKHFFVHARHRCLHVPLSAVPRPTVSWQHLVRMLIPSFPAKTAGLWLNTLKLHFFFFYFICNANAQETAVILQRPWSIQSQGGERRREGKR